MWNLGDQIVLRYRWGGRLSWVEPVTVVEDSPDGIALYMAMDTPIKRPVGADGQAVPRFQSLALPGPSTWRLGDGMWIDTSVLWLARPEEAHAIGLFWQGGTGEFLGWYGNLQAPLVRTALGFDSSDHVLDVDIAPDRSWRWKDEDELAIVQDLGLISHVEANAIRAEGERVIAAVERNDWPFNAGWERWRPEASWPIPTLPAGWDQGAEP